MVLTGIAHYETTCRVTIDGKPIGPHTDEDTARIIADWLRRMTWPDFERVMEHAPEEPADIYTPRGAHPCGRSIADSNAEFQDMEAAIAERFDTATIQKGR